MKVPFVQNVEYFDKRLLEFNAEPKEVIASDQKRLIVDAFVRYRIVDPLSFYQSAGDERIMRSRHNSILESSLRQVLGSVPLSQIISKDRAATMERIRAIVRREVSQSENKVEGAAVEGGKKIVRGFGIEVVDVRIMRTDLPTANSQAIYHRMQTEREREAKEFRAQGAEEAQRIRSRADRERVVILATAQKEADITRGEGEAQASAIFADAFNLDADFYQFYRTMQAYRQVLKPSDTTMVLTPDHAFLKLMEAPGRATK
jgi:membrane protease subunit HflC